MRHPYFDVGGPMILGHRGAAGSAPENTLPSFRRCLELGAHAIESDVQVSADGVPVLLHDAVVDRVTNGSGSADTLAFEALQALDAAHHFTIDDRGRTEPDDDAAFRGRNFRIPSVREAFEALPEARFNLEIKTSANDAVRTVVDLVAEHERADRTLLVAADDGIMKLLRETLETRGVDAATSACIAEVAAVVRSAIEGSAPPPAVQALQVPDRFGGSEVITEPLLDHTRRHGIAVHVWTINEPGTMSRLLDAGIDGLVTDFPERAARLLDAR